MTKAVVHANMAVRGMQEEAEATRSGKKPRPGSAGPLPSAASPKVGGGAARPSSAAVHRSPRGDGRSDGYQNAGNDGAAPTGGATGGGEREEAEPDDVGNEEEEEAFDVGMRQNAMEYDAADVNKDTKLDFGEFSAMIRERESG